MLDELFPAAVAAEVQALCSLLGGIEEGESLASLVHAEALATSGDREGARLAIGEARDRLLQRASKIENDGWRRSFLERVATMPGSSSSPAPGWVPLGDRCTA